MSAATENVELRPRSFSREPSTGGVSRVREWCARLFACSKKRQAPLAGALLNGEALKRRLQVLSLGRVLINRHQMLTWMCRPTSVLGGKEDMPRACQYVC